MPFALAKLSREMKINAFTLRFPKKIEEKFIQHYDTESMPLLRNGMIVGIILYAAFGILDAFMVSNISPNFYIIRFGIVIPFGSLMYVLSFFKLFKHYMQTFLVYTMVVAGAGLAGIILLTEPPLTHMYYAGVILLTITNYTMFRMRFLYSVFSGWLILIIYLLSATVIVKTPASILANNLVFLIGTNIIGMYASYYFEFTFRRDYYLVNLLEEERDKVSDANKYLEDRIAERTQQLVKSNEALKKEMHVRKLAEKKRRELEEKLFYFQKMETVGTLTGGIAHDFNNILATILGYAEIIEQSQDIDPKTKEYILNIEKASLRAKDLIVQLQTFSRQLKPKMVKDKLNGIVNEAVGFVKPVLPQKIALKTNIRETEVVEADHTQIHQIIINLCSNAHHALKEQGGEIEIGLNNKSVQENGKAKSFVALTVKDNGSGMSEEVKKRIFEPYFTTKPVNEGHGLGLSMVHGIVKNHKGIINIYSEIGKGTEFEVLIPVNEIEN